MITVENSELQCLNVDMYIDMCIDMCIDVCESESIRHNFSVHDAVELYHLNIGCSPMMYVYECMYMNS